ncbi:MAG: hypothetical protein JXQ29_07540 [Planctomycetes bacterium]|nr:hypothetical protein [Planctomycetota bacterium]
MLIFAAVFAGLTLAAGRAAWVRRGADGFAGTEGGAAGTLRDVDLERIRELIRQQRLSDHEAEFYRPAAPAPAAPASRAKGKP